MLDCVREHRKAAVFNQLRNRHDRHFEPQIRLVRTVAFHRFLPGNAPEGFAATQSDEHLRAELFRKLAHQRLHDGKDIFLFDEAHFHVQLVEFAVMPVRSRVFIAEAGRDLEIAVESADHQELLELLRRLRQGVEFARVIPRRDEKIPRSFGRRVGENRGLDLDESAVLEIIPDMADETVLRFEHSLDLLAAQIEKSVRETHRFIHLVHLLLVDLERRGLRPAKDLEPLYRDFNLSGRELRVYHISRTHEHFAFRLDHPFAPQAVSQLPAILGYLRIELDLRKPVAVPQIDKDYPAVVAPPVHPAGQHDALAFVFFPQLSACVRP